jgi:ubiquinone/menaquinone biosynthesis C-methylase UbiE
MTPPDWNQLADLGTLQAVLDPRDETGFKNRLIDRIQWTVLRPKLQGAQHVLDFGCGLGRFADRIHQLGANYTGIDESANMIKIAQAHHADRPFQFQHFDGVNIPFAAQTFDVGFSCGVIQCVGQAQTRHRIIQDLRRVLKPGGKFIAMEQTSRSNQTSGEGMPVLTELNYRQEFETEFTIQDLLRVRRGRFSKLTDRMLRLGKTLPWVTEMALSGLAQHEFNSIQTIRDADLSALRYYDILIEAIAR